MTASPLLLVLPLIEAQPRCLRGNLMPPLVKGCFKDVAEQRLHFSRVLAVFAVGREVRLLRLGIAAVQRLRAGLGGCKDKTRGS
jgi:hypothetical protein